MFGSTVSSSLGIKQYLARVQFRVRVGQAALGFSQPHIPRNFGIKGGQGVQMAKRGLSGATGPHKSNKY